MTFIMISDQLQHLKRSDLSILQKLKQNAAPYNFAIEFEYYDFSGVSYKEAEKNMETKAMEVINIKTEKGDIAIGVVKILPLSASFKSFRYDTNRKVVTAYPVAMTIQYAVKVILPRFTGIALPKELEKIHKTVAAITKHEQGHVCIAVAAFNKMKQAALGFNGTGKTRVEAGNNLNAKIKKTLDSIIAESVANQAEYDNKTYHGSITIEQEKYNETITPECDAVYTSKTK